MKTIYYTDRNGAEAIAKGLNEIFGNKEENSEIAKSYSLGFLRMTNLTKSKRQESFKCLLIEGFGSGIENQNELKRRLEKMTEAEFRDFKENNVKF